MTFFSVGSAKEISITSGQSYDYETYDCWNKTQSTTYTISTDETIEISWLIISITWDNEIIKHIELIEKWDNSLLPDIYHGWTEVRNDNSAITSMSDSTSLTTEALFELSLEKVFLKPWGSKTFEIKPIIWCDTSSTYSIDVIWVNDRWTFRFKQDDSIPNATFNQEMTITPIKWNDISIESFTFDDELRIATLETCFETSQPAASFENWISSTVKIINSSRGSWLEIFAQRDNELTESCIEHELTYDQLWIDQQHQNNLFQAYINESRSYNLREDDMRNNYYTYKHEASVDYSVKKPTLEWKDITSFPWPKISFELCNISFNTTLINPWGEIRATIKNKTNNITYHTTGRYNQTLDKDQCIYFWAHRKDLWIRNEWPYLINVIIEDQQFLSQFNEIEIFRPKLLVEEWEEVMIRTHSELEFWRVLISEKDVTATVCNNWWVPISNKEISLRFNKILDERTSTSQWLLWNHEHTETVSLKSGVCHDIVAPIENFPEEFFENNPEKKLKIRIYSSYTDIQEYYYWNNSTVITLEIEQKKKKPYSERDFCRYSNCVAYIERINTLKEKLFQQEKREIQWLAQYLISNQSTQDKKDILLFLLDYLE